MELIQLLSRLTDDTYIRLNSGNLYKGYIKDLTFLSLRDFFFLKVLKVTAVEKGVISIRIE